MVDKGVVIWKEKEFEPSDIVDAYLVIAATNEPSLIVSLSRCSALGKTTLPFDASPTLLNNVCSGKA
jgi:siroheme synthase (precorrin-2 oxidase/ferrochelatase)